MKGVSVLVAAAICSACSGGAVAPSTASLNAGFVGRTAYVNGRPVTAAHPYLSALPRFATLLPDRRTNQKTYEYIINDYTTYATIIDFPKSDRQIGEINNVGGQGCANVLYGPGKNRFWIVAGKDQITEYAPEQKPLKTLSVNVGMPSSCAMDISGDLAVGILNGSGAGDVVIFKNATGKGTVITTPLIKEYFDGYDPQGNLFFDGFNRRDKFELVEIPEGTTKAQAITTSNKVKFPGSVQWDGKYLTVTDQEADAMYRYTVNETTATLKGTVQLSGSRDCAQTWITTGIVYCADAGNNDGEVFKYPAGGSIYATLTGNFDLPLGTTVAEK